MFGFISNSFVTVTIIVNQCENPCRVFYFRILTKVLYESRRRNDDGGSRLRNYSDSSEVLLDKNGPRRPFNCIECCTQSNVVSTSSLSKVRTDEVKTFGSL